MSLNPSEHIAVPVSALPAMVKAAYDLSLPRGMGFIHFNPDTMGDEAAAKIIESRERDTLCAVSMDYVSGRCCKFVAYRNPDDAETVLIRPHWYDHSDADLVALLKRAGIEDAREQIDAAVAAASRAA